MMIIHHSTPKAHYDLYILPSAPTSFCSFGLPGAEFLLKDAVPILWWLLSPEKAFKMGDDDVFPKVGLSIELMNSIENQEIQSGQLSWSI
jgi:hypothetical protein